MSFSDRLKSTLEKVDTQDVKRQYIKQTVKEIVALTSLFVISWLILKK